MKRSLQVQKQLVYARKLNFTSRYGCLVSNIRNKLKFIYDLLSFTALGSSIVIQILPTCVRYFAVYFENVT